MDKMVERDVRDYVQCAASDKTYCTRQLPLVCRQLPNHPWDEVALNIIGPIRGEHQTPYLLVLIDFYSRRAEVMCVADVATRNVVRFLEEIFKKESYPNSILTDNGPQFVSEEFKKYLQDRGIIHKRSSIYHPKTN